MITFALALALGCRRSPPSEPDDVDLSRPRSGFRCGAGASGDAAEACRVLDEFERAGPVRALPAGAEVQVWLGVDHCVQPTVSGHFAAHQLVYLRAGAGSAPANGTPRARVLEHAAVFGSSQIDTVAMPDVASALASIARGEVPNPATTHDLWRAIPRDASGAYQTLVRTQSGRSIGNGTADQGLWFLRSDGSHLLLVSPRVQGGCATPVSQSQACANARPGARRDSIRRRARSGLAPGLFTSCACRLRRACTRTL